MSLDGLIARPNDDIDWAFHYGSDNMVNEVMGEIGAVVSGNRGFKEETMNESSLPYGGMVKVPQFVVTHEAHEPVTIGGLTFTFITDGIERVIEIARNAAGASLLITLQYDKLVLDTYMTVNNNLPSCMCPTVTPSANRLTGPPNYPCSTRPIGMKPCPSGANSPRVNRLRLHP